MIDQTKTANREQPNARYAISEEAADELRRSLAIVAYSRQCYTCRREMEIAQAATLPMSDFMERIADHCSEEPDYLLPDTPLKEAVFRILLARRNAPVTAEEIGEDLSEKWALTQFQRDTSPGIMRLLLNNVRGYYCIEAV